MQPQSIASLLANQKDVSSTIYFDIGNVCVLFRTTGDKPRSVMKVNISVYIIVITCVQMYLDVHARSCGCVQILAFQNLRIILKIYFAISVKFCIRDTEKCSYYEGKWVFLEEQPMSLRYHWNQIFFYFKNVGVLGLQFLKAVCF